MAEGTHGEDDATEVFAYFGKAIFMANVVETALAQTLMQVEFMKGVRNEFVRTKGHNFSPKKYEQDFDAFMKEQISKTMGKLKLRVEEMARFDDKLKSRISQATERRNFLAHHFWRESGTLLLTKAGRDKMIGELKGDCDIFERLEQDIIEATKPIRQELGIRDEELNARVEKRMADIMKGLELEGSLPSTQQTSKETRVSSGSNRTERYNAAEAEARWQKVWDERGIFATPNRDLGKKYYVLEMFPYPSGRIHMGHVRNYTMGDVVARVKRARGFSVLHPMGWDAFGMPAENAAMERKVHPKKWTYDNIAAMKKQLKSMGLSLDWSREIATCDPAYYKHQQKMFLDFLRAGLVERKQSKVNWDPVDQTVLANEQVIDGRGWRSGALVEQRELTQWFFAITKFAEPLLEALETLDRWPEKVRLMQKNWIGRSEGLLVRFALDPKTTPNGESELEIFTTRADTLVRRQVHGAVARSSAGA